jgi:transposase InsO family protein
MVKFRSDNGGEYISDAFKEYLAEAKIKHETSTFYYPQQNNKEKRANMIIIKSVKSMLHSQKFNLNFWAEATHTAIHVFKRVRFRPHEGKTTYEPWTS